MKREADCQENRDEELQLTEAIGQVARDAGKIILSAREIENQTTVKSGHANFVTEYDKRVQAFIFEELHRILPEANFVGEEDGAEQFRPEYREGYAFVVDPIDGTMNFMQGLDLSVISIGLLREGKPWIGVVYNPYRELLFSAVHGRGACLNGEQIHCSREPLSRSLVEFGTSPYYPELSKKSLAIAGEYLKRGADLRRFGTAAWDLSLCAWGKLGIYFELRLGLWDYCAGALIAMESGCRVTDIEGNPLHFQGPSSILCASAGAAEEDYLPGEILEPQGE